MARLPKLLQRHPAWRLVRDWVAPVLAMILVLGAFRSSVADWNDVPTGSMKPTILEGDRIVVNKLAYDLKIPLTGWRLWTWSGPKRGDVVICRSPEDGIRLVKRVLGLPGDTIEMRNNRLIINGTPAGYAPLDHETIGQIDATNRQLHRYASESTGGEEHPIMITPGLPAPRSFAAVTIPTGHYFMLGDNRDNSKDSRWFGLVPRGQVVGQAVGIALSFDRQNWYAPRWGRFFTPMQ